MFNNKHGERSANPKGAFGSDPTVHFSSGQNEHHWTVDTSPDGHFPREQDAPEVGTNHSMVLECEMLDPRSKDSIGMESLGCRGWIDAFCEVAMNYICLGLDLHQGTYLTNSDLVDDLLGVIIARLISETMDEAVASDNVALFSTIFCEKKDSGDMLFGSRSFKIQDGHPKIWPNGFRVFRIARCAKHRTVYEKLCICYNIPDDLKLCDLLQNVRETPPEHEDHLISLPRMLLTDVEEAELTTKGGPKATRRKYFQTLAQEQDLELRMTPILRHILESIKAKISRSPTRFHSFSSALDIRQKVLQAVWGPLAQDMSEPWQAFTDPEMQWSRSMGFLDIDMWLAVISLLASVINVFKDSDQLLHTWCFQACQSLEALIQPGLLLSIALYHTVSMESPKWPDINTLVSDLETSTDYQTPYLSPGLAMRPSDDHLSLYASSNSSFRRFRKTGHASPAITVSMFSESSGSSGISSVMEPSRFLRKSYSSLDSTHLLGQRTASLVSFSSKAASSHGNKEEDSEFRRDGATILETDEDGDVAMELSDTLLSTNGVNSDAMQGPRNDTLQETSGWRSIYQPSSVDNLLRQAFPQVP